MVASAGSSGYRDRRNKIAMPPILTRQLDAIEPEIHAIGEEILQRAEDAAPSIFSKERWQQMAMEWMTTDEVLKGRLFRFIETLPRLRNEQEIAGKLKEQLHRDNGHPPLPGPLQLALAYRRNDSLYAALVAGLVRWGCEQSARQFICGQTPEEAIDFVLRLRRGGMTFTLDLLGETVHSAEIARGHVETYLRLIKELSASARMWPANPLLDEAPWGPIPRVNISIKLTALAANIGHLPPEAAAQSMVPPLREIFRAARNAGAFINVDMEHYAIKDITLEVFMGVLMEEEFRDWADCGIVIQAYLRETPDDMRDLAAWAQRRETPVTVRLVKGAYWDSETAAARAAGVEPPVWTEKWQSDACFEETARIMIDSADVLRPAIGSHNVRSIAAALAYARAVGLPPRTVELQMLTGMGDPLKRALVAMRERVRVYSPFGDLVRGMSYLIRRLIENTSNDSFLRQSFSADASHTELLENPVGRRGQAGMYLSRLSDL